MYAVQSSFLQLSISSFQKLLKTLLEIEGIEKVAFLSLLGHQTHLQTPVKAS